jgi:uncharacterized protein YdhG (YjbR/CyaY superfamily)
MKPERLTPKNVDDYIEGFPSDVQNILQKIRTTIQKAAPPSTEAISYQMPTFELNGKAFISFAAYKSHIGMYPAPRGIEEFEQDVLKYGSGKGTLQFQLDNPIPYDLISRIVKFRVKKTLEAAEAQRREKLS